MGLRTFGRWTLPYLIGLLAIGSGAAAQVAPVPVEIRGAPGNYALYRGGEPYIVKGAGSQAVQDLASLARHGGNSVRNWAVEDGGILDRAHELGLTVGLCLDVQRERHGFDYDDAAAVQAQFKRLRAQVMAHRNHPALLFWIIGNELNHDYQNPAVYDAVNDIAGMIQDLDPNHPTTTTTAGIDQALAQVIQERAPNLDFLSVQVYGGLRDLPETLAKIDLQMPLMVTEWGTKGHWEVPQTPWGAPIELNSSAKARFYWEGHEQVLKPMAGRLIGNYAFLWGQKQERTPTWYGVFTADGGRTEAVDTLQRIWTGHWPANRSPQLSELLVDGKRAGDAVRLLPGASYTASVQAADPNGDGLRFDWRVAPESQATQTGGDSEEVPAEIHLPTPDGRTPQITWRAPKQAGAYRFFVYVDDGQGGVAHANVPFLVTGE